MNNISIKVGDYIKALFNGSEIQGVVTDIKKSIVVIEKYKGVGHWEIGVGYSDYVGTNTFVNIRKIHTIEKIEKK
jgi:hypothetical protein